MWTKHVPLSRKALAAVGAAKPLTIAKARNPMAPHGANRQLVVIAE